MRIISNEELLAVVGGSSLEGSDGSEDLMDGSEDYMYFVDDVRKVKPGGGSQAPSNGGNSQKGSQQNGGSAQNGSQQVNCPPNTIPLIKQTTQSSNGQGSGGVGIRTPGVGGSLQGQGSGSESKTEITITCVPVKQ